MNHPAIVGYERPRRIFRVMPPSHIQQKRRKRGLPAYLVETIYEDSAANLLKLEARRCACSEQDMSIEDTTNIV